MRIVDQKGLGEGMEMRWLIKDLHEELKAWGRPGGDARVHGSKVASFCARNGFGKHIQPCMIIFDLVIIGLMITITMIQMSWALGPAYRLTLMPQY